MPANNKRKIPKLDFEMNNFLEKILRQKKENLQFLENFKKNITQTLDEKITVIYQKKNLIHFVKIKRKELKKYKISFFKNLRLGGFKKIIRHFLSLPFIYSMIIPAIIMHIFVEIYHQVCFRLYKIPRVSAKKYFVFDRTHLPYLNWFEKFNCLYCSYFNCLVAYSREIAGRTERYWCPIKHAQRMDGVHEHYDKFCDFSDGKTVRQMWKKIRKFKEFE